MQVVSTSRSIRFSEHSLLRDLPGLHEVLRVRCGRSSRDNLSEPAPEDQPPRAPRAPTQEPKLPAYVEDVGLVERWLALDSEGYGMFLEGNIADRLGLQTELYQYLVRGRVEDDWRAVFPDVVLPAPEHEMERSRWREWVTFFQDNEAAIMHEMHRVEEGLRIMEHPFLEQPPVEGVNWLVAMIPPHPPVVNPADLHHRVADEDADDMEVDEEEDESKEESDSEDEDESEEDSDSEEEHGEMGEVGVASAYTRRRWREVVVARRAGDHETETLLITQISRINDELARYGDRRQGYTFREPPATRQM